MVVHVVDTNGFFSYFFGDNVRVLFHLFHGRFKAGFGDDLSFHGVRGADGHLARFRFPLRVTIRRKVHFRRCHVCVVCHPNGSDICSVVVRPFVGGGNFSALTRGVLRFVHHHVFFFLYPQRRHGDRFRAFTSVPISLPIYRGVSNTSHLTTRHGKVLEANEGRSTGGHHHRVIRLV